MKFFVSLLLVSFAFTSSFAHPCTSTRPTTRRAIITNQCVCHNLFKLTEFQRICIKAGYSPSECIGAMNNGFRLCLNQLCKPRNRPTPTVPEAARRCDDMFNSNFVQLCAAKGKRLSQCIKQIHNGMAECSRKQLGKPCSGTAPPAPVAIKGCVCDDIINPNFVQLCTTKGNRLSQCIYQIHDNMVACSKQLCKPVLTRLA